MLSRLHLQNFTVFADADFVFSKGLNVLVGTNGTGKSHVLKAGYAMLNALSGRTVTESELEIALSGTLTLKAIMLGDALGDSNSLVRWGDALKTVVRATVAKSERAPTNQLALNITRDSEGTSTGLEEVSLTEDYVVRFPVLIPAKEATTLLTDVEPLMREYKIRLDKTYQEIWNQLRRPRRLALTPDVQQLVDKLDQEVGGQLDNNGQQFFVVTADGVRYPVLLEAEGKRKLAALATLLANGALTPETTLFWDEPEANLNPALLKKLAQVLAELARQGFQIILATHSLFLLKELHILSRKPDAQPLPIRYFSLSKTAEPNAPVTVTAADELIHLPDIVALDTELDQTLDFEVALHGRDAHH